jgi:hypothetical protein
MKTVRRNTMTKSVEFEGETYRHTGSQWINARTFTVPPLVISRQLDQRYGSVSSFLPSTAEPPIRGARPKGSRGRDFTGLAESDFKKGTTGTHWRARDSLGGLLAQRLSAVTGRSFQSHAIYPRAIVLIGEPPRFAPNNENKLNFRVAKYSFRLNEHAAHYGFYIEKSDEPMNEEWEWPRFLKALSQPMLVESLESASRKHDLRWSIDRWNSRQENGQWGDPHNSFEVLPADPLLRLHEGEQLALSWEQFAGELEHFSPGVWCDLRLHHTMPKLEAIEWGASIAEPVTEVFRALLPLYDACGKS